MAHFLIESSQNKTVKYISSLSAKKYRDKYNKFIIEGEKFVAEIPENWDVEFYAFSETYVLNNDIEPYKAKADTYTIKDRIFNSVSDTVNPQGILAVCEKKKYYTDDIIKNKNAFIVILEETNDPGNLGTIIRTADAAGADGIIISQNSAEIYNPKVIRASAGSVFNIPLVVDVDIIDLLPKLRQKDIITYAAHLKGKEYPYTFDFKKGVALLIGNESRGLSDDLASKADNFVKLPILGGAESLNASVAAGILIYEVVRQRL